MPTTIATFNGGNAAPARTPGDLTLIGADIIGGQEFFDRAAAAEHWCRLHGYGNVPFDHGQGDTPIFYSTDKAHLLDWDSRVVNPHPVHVGGAGNGPDTIHPKYVTHAKFWLREEHRLVHVLNTHPLASWTRHDLPVAEQHARRQLAAEHFVVLADFIQSLHGTVVALGDWNGEKTEHLMHPVTSIPDFDLGKTPPTEKGRTIDFVGVKGRHVTQVRRTVIDGTSSDHKPVKARISFEERLKYQGLGTK